MRIQKIFRPMVCTLLLAGCGPGNEPVTSTPYSNFQEPPLVQALLHSVSLAGESAAVARSLEQAGYTPLALQPNYSQADAVEAAIWGVAEPVAAGARLFKAPPGRPDIRLLDTPPSADAVAPAPGFEAAFFRNVLGTSVPAWPLPGERPGGLRIQAWTYAVPDILAASRRLRENGIPVVYNPVSISTTYLGTYKTLAIRAPDGTVVQLVEATAQ